MEFVKQLAAVIAAVEKNGGLLAWRPEGLQDLWIAYINAPSEDAILTGLSDPVRELYRAWLDQFYGQQPAALQEPEPEVPPEPEEETYICVNCQYLSTKSELEEQGEGLCPACGKPVKEKVEPEPKPEEKPVSENVTTENVTTENVKPIKKRRIRVVKSDKS